LAGVCAGRAIRERKEKNKRCVKKDHLKMRTLVFQPSKKKGSKDAGVARKVGSF